ncbi:VgrG protein [Enhygromyxa salina]|uniref:VgrG protein n=1 Tax=Enhygromyxa salina TaxID=215803 RepID=A0A0C2CZS7_9BACT|nr:type VI secretion system tip protein TssI/VgrG [Enhygromyxa salina]KIG16486.1 VgrG protein [Enhygromyxa salina]
MQDLIRLDHVRYLFFVDGGADVDWHVRHIDCIESLSKPYEIVVDLISDGAEVSLAALLGANVELTLERYGLVRTRHGIVHRVEEIGVSSAQHLVRVYVVPALRLLEQQVNTRVFQGQTVPEILQAVLGSALAEYNREVDTNSGLLGQYVARDYCVQFRESDFDFCSRIMEEEGIAYHFEGDDDNLREQLVLVDNNDAYPEVVLALGDAVPIIHDRFEEADRESIQGLEYVLTEQMTKVATRGYNWKVPDNLDESVRSGEDPYGRPRELYLFDDRRQIVDDPVHDPRARSFDGSGLAQREPLAIRRLELAQSELRTIVGTSNIIGLGPGRQFTLGEHRRAELSDQTFLVTRVRHEGDLPEEELGRTDAECPRYTNSFECIPIERTFRPHLLTPKPRVHGAQTATVMGPADDPNEDIHTDPHGRIKVRFHWDRIGSDDETASCWIRVAHAWAGAGWGSLFIPRVGMEVVIDFLDGNPDRPLAVGCVYNGNQTPPYPLPDEKTKSTIKSESSPGGGGFNELRFDDAKGSEEIFLHAQKDLNETVLNDHTTTVSANHSTTVGADQSNVVSGNQTHTVSGNQTNTVSGNQTESVSGNQTNTVSGNQTESVSGNQTMTVSKNRTVTVTGSQSMTIVGSAPADGVSGSKLGITGDYVLDASNTIAVQAPTELKLTCGGSTITMIPGKITFNAGGGALLVLDANATMTSNGGSNVTLDGNATTTSSDGSQVLLDANATVSSPGVSTVSAPTSVLTDGGGSVAVSGGNITCRGGSVDVSGDTVNITGGLVNVN